MKIKNKFNQSFGELEAVIMDILWELNTVCVRDVLKELEKKREIAYTTVMTVMTRLYNKGILKRKLDKSGAYIYRPTQDKQLFLANTSKKAIKNFIKEFGEVAVAGFIDIIEDGDLENAKDWQKKLKKVLDTRQNEK